MLEGKLRKTLVGLAAVAALACGKGSCGSCSGNDDSPPALGSGYFDDAKYGANEDGCREGCYKEDPKESCCWCPDKVDYGINK